MIRSGIGIWKTRLPDAGGQGTEVTVVSDSRLDLTGVEDGEVLLTALFHEHAVIAKFPNGIKDGGIAITTLDGLPVTLTNLFNHAGGDIRAIVSGSFNHCLDIVFVAIVPWLLSTDIDRYEVGSRRKSLLDGIQVTAASSSRCGVLKDFKQAGTDGFTGRHFRHCFISRLSHHVV